MKRKEVIFSVIGFVFGIAAAVWLFFPYDIMAATEAAGTLRLLCLIPTIGGAFLGYLAAQ